MAQDPEFAKLAGESPGLERIAGGFHRTGGPVFSRRGYLLFCDQPERIMKWERGKLTVYREKSNGARALTFDHQGRLLACEAGRVTRTEKDGSITVLARTGGEPADLVYSIDGSVYFTQGAEVLQIAPRGKPRTVARDLPGAAAGVALAPNQQHLYVSCSGAVRRYRIAPDGALTEGRTFAELPGAAGGLKTDEAANVWVATPAGVRVFNRAGRLLGTVTLPEAPGNCNWGEGFRNLYITAQTSVYRLETTSSGTRTY